MTSQDKDIIKIKEQLLSDDPLDFEAMALEVFQFQSTYNKVYRQYIQYKGIKPSKVERLEQIPFLPISFYKHHTIRSSNAIPLDYFYSSGTTSIKRSSLPVFDYSFYEQISKRIFEDQFGPLSQYRIFALLPGYLERKNSSLVHMLSCFIKETGVEESGFFLNNYDLLLQKMREGLHSGKQVMIWGVTHALLDLVSHMNDLKVHDDQAIVIETGGMKGLRKEMVKEELYDQFSVAFTTKKMHSEYGMTELFSQAYAGIDQKLKPGFTLSARIRSWDDPGAWCSIEETGLLCLIDLANVETCSFIETEDLANRFVDGSFTVLGRLDYSDLRGCNLMVM
jgi:hypothetical protein